MLRTSLIGATLVAITIVIHAIGSTMWVRHVTQRYSDDSDWRNRLSISILVQTVLVLIALHAIEIMVWAGSYMVLLPDGELASFEKAVYFSFVTFTTLGYGDITLSEGWRILSGIEALNGILLVGWTTALLFAFVQRMWRGLATKK